MKQITDAQLHKALHDSLDALGAPPRDLEQRVRAALRTSPNEGGRGMRSFKAAALGLAVAATLAGVLVAGLSLRAHNQPRASSTAAATPVTAPTANLGAWATSDFVWLRAPVLQSVPAPGGTGVKLTGYEMDVIDWTGAVRGRFNLPVTVGARNQDVAAISGDGHLALLGDGRVLNQSGATVATIPVTASTSPMASFNSRFADDDSGVCTATPAAPSSPDHRVTVDFVSLDGHVAPVATVGTEPLSQAQGSLPDSASVLSCSRTADLAVVARYNDLDSASSAPGPINNDVTIALWAVRLSTGQVLWQQPAQRIATGRPFAYGSSNGALAVEFLPGSGSQQELDQVVHIPSGATVPGAVSGIEDTAALSADGSRILRRIIEPSGSQTLLQLIDASSGAVLRTITLPGRQGVFAVSEPGGATFLFAMQKQLYTMDASGKLSQVPTSLTLNGEYGASMMTPNGLQS